MSADVREALLVVDVQQDFCEGGALGVPDGDRVVPALNRLIADAARHGVPVFATRDWHPAVTVHFEAHGGLWPPHCVQGTDGARFHPDLQLPPSTILMNKGDDPQAQGYSAFESHTADGVFLAKELRSRGIEHLYIGGLATDYCVRQSVFDARREGIRVTVVQDAIAGIDVQAGDSDRAIAEMREAGAEFTTSGDVVFRERRTVSHS